MQLYNFEKSLILPSGGLSYSPFIWLKPVNQELILMDVDPVYKDSSIEYMTTIIKSFTVLPVDILDIYIDDFFYIWMNLLSIDLQRSTEINEISKCSECDHINNLLIDLTEMEFKILNPFDVTCSEEYEYLINDINIKYRHRTVGDCILFGNMYMHLSNEDKTFSSILYFIQQITELKYNDEIIPKNEHLNFLINRHLYEVFSIYKKIINIDGEFGIKKIIKFKCKKCEKINITKIFNDMSYSFIAAGDTKNIFNEQKNRIKYLMNFSSMHPMKINDFLKFPVRFESQLNNVLNTAKTRNGSLFTLYNDGIV